MYNAYQGRPPPGLTQQQSHHHHHHQNQYQHPHQQSPLPPLHHHQQQQPHAQLTPQLSLNQSSNTDNNSSSSNTLASANPHHHVNTFTPASRPSPVLRATAAPHAPRSSAAIPIIRPDGSITTSNSGAATAASPFLGVRNVVGVTAPSPAAAASSSLNQLASPLPGKAAAAVVGNNSSNASGLSKAAAGAAVFVPKGSSNSGSFDKSEADATASDFGSMYLGAAGRSGGGGTGEGNGIGSAIFVPAGKASNPYARAVAGGSASAVFTPASHSGRGTPTEYGAGGGPSGYDSEGLGNSAFDPTYAGPMPPPSHGGPNNAGYGGGGGGLGGDSASIRPFNPYEHMDQHGHGGYDDGSSAQSIKPLRQPLQYHLSAPPLPHTSNLHPQHMAQHAYFMSPSLREDLFRRNEAINVAAPSVADLGGTQTRPPQPEEVHVYKDLVALEPDSSGPLPYGSRGNPITVGGVPTQLLPRHLLPVGANGLLTSTGALSSLPISSSGGPLAPSSALGGYPTEVHRATCTLDGKTYVLRRIVGFNLGREKERALEGVERWRRLRCPGVVNVREAFTSWRWGEASIVFVYDFHPLSTTLFAEHLLPRPPRVDPRTGRLQAVDMHVTERRMWSYLCQIASALRQVHKLGLAARCIELGKILLTGKNRVRINCCSILDVLTYDPQNPPSAESTAQHQAKDLYKLGILLLCLSSQSSTAGSNVGQALDNLGRHYSKELHHVVSWLVQSAKDVESEYGTRKCADELLRLLGPHMSDELEASENYTDLLEDSLTRELENARLVRLLCKMGFINERPEYDHDPHWSSTGERYLISLFRDYLFHSVEEGSGKPVLDLSHLLSNLNRLDAGSEDRIMLTSRDEQSCLVVSYKEIKAAMDSAFADLSRHA